MGKPTGLAQIETNECSIGLRHTGTRSMLMAAGLATEDQFPGAPGCGKTSTVFPASGDRQKKRVARRSTYLFEVLVYWTPEEKAQYDARLRDRLDRAWEDHCAQSAAHLTRAVFEEHGAEAPRKMAEASLEAAGLSLIRAFNMTDDPAHPWSFPKETHEAVRRCVWELQDLFQGGGFGPRLGGVMQADGDFQRFMARATAAAATGPRSAAARDARRPAQGSGAGENA